MTTNERRGKDFHGSGERAGAHGREGERACRDDLWQCRVGEEVQKACSMPSAVFGQKATCAVRIVVELLKLWCDVEPK